MDVDNVTDDRDVKDGDNVIDDGDAGKLVLVCCRLGEGVDEVVKVVEVVFNEIVDDVEVNKTVRHVVSDVVPHP